MAHYDSSYFGDCGVRYLGTRIQCFKLYLSAVLTGERYEEEDNKSY